jgi:hypothetical protein
VNCQRFEELAPQIAHRELRDAELLRDAANHAASCAVCNALLTDARTVAAPLAALAAHDKSQQPATHLETSLRAAFLRQHALSAPTLMPDSGTVLVGAGSRSTRSNVSAGATFRWAALSLLAAAIILAALFLPRAFNRKPETNRAKSTPTQSPSIGVPPINPPVQNAATNTPTAALVEPKRAIASRRAPKNNAAAPEKTLTGFLPLPFADEFSTIRYGVVVRMQMSRSDLAWLGLPVSVNDSGQKVVADLFVNESGVPEAIRLVR